jgi:predicted hydrocarbon binding protein
MEQHVGLRVRTAGIARIAHQLDRAVAQRPRGAHPLPDPPHHPAVRPGLRERKPARGTLGQVRVGTGLSDRVRFVRDDVVEGSADRGTRLRVVVQGERGVRHWLTGDATNTHSTINFSHGSKPASHPKKNLVSATVDPLVPLALLEAVRTVDLPDEELETEFVEELRIKRFGLSETVHAQIRRYHEAVKRGQRPSAEEAAGIARLIGRRPDAEAVFREGGRNIARRTYERVSPLVRKLTHLLPALFARPLALSQIRRIGERYFAGDVRRVGASIHLEVKQSVTLDAAPKLAGCTFYESALRELMQQLVDGVGAVEHVRCASRGEGSCEWRAQWRT